MKKQLKMMGILSILALSLTQLARAETAGSGQSVTPGERAKIEGVVHDYLKAKPEVILESVQALQQKQMDQMQQTIKQTQNLAAQFVAPLMSAKGDAVGGNPNGKVTLVEFFDYQCPHCIDMDPILDQFLKNNKEVRVVYKEWPIRGPLSQTAAQMAMAANVQGKYYEFHHALMTSGQLGSEDQLMAIAKSVGLDLQKLKTDMNGEAVKAKLKETSDLAQSLKLFGTPAIFIGKTPSEKQKTTKVIYVPGVMNEAQLKEAIGKV